MSKTNGELTGCLQELRLPTARACYQELAEAARRETLSYEAYLLEVVQRECQLRRQHRMERLLRESHLPVDKSLEAFDLKRLPGKVSAVVRTLLDGSFVDRKENVLVFGTPGAGKSHLLIYCHVIDWLVCKSEAFADYGYQADPFYCKAKAPGVLMALAVAARSMSKPSLNPTHTKCLP